MTGNQIVFNDGNIYESAMGAWSHLVGHPFLEWLDTAPGDRWLDVGCGSGALTELIADRCAPAELHGIDPSEAQLSFARQRKKLRNTTLKLGNAMDLPFDDGRFDAAIMALVLFFIPDPIKGVAEMRRVTRAGGQVAAYVWDYVGDAAPTAPIEAALRAQGVEVARPPRYDVSHVETLRQLWSDAAFEDIEVKSFLVQRIFSDFEDYWRSTTSLTNIGPVVSTLPAETVARLKERLRAQALTDATGRVTFAARANAIKGRAPIR